VRKHDFAPKTKETLAKRVAMRCSNPLCQKVTSGPRDDPAMSVNIGVAAHITAASEGGPRYDVSLTPRQRSSSQNGIWLCQTCAKLVDNDVQRFTADLLREWKHRAENNTRLEVEGQVCPVRNAEVEPVKFNSLLDPKLKEIIQEYRQRGEETRLRLLVEKDSLLLQGWRAAHLRGTAREILAGYTGVRFEHILMIKPKSGF
jgi:hypothetical protein